MLRRLPKHRFGEPLAHEEGRIRISPLEDPALEMNNAALVVQRAEKIEYAR